MPNYRPIIFISLLFSISLYAQKGSSGFKNQIKISPIRIVDLINPGYELSYERSYLKNLSTQFSGAYMYDAFGISSYENYKGIRIALEEKYFIYKLRKFQPYASAEIVFFQATLDKSNWYFEHNTSDTSSVLYNDEFSADKKMLTGNLKTGFQFLIRHFVIDFCIGGGIKYKSIRYSNMLFPDDKPYFRHGEGGAVFGFLPPTLQEGERFGINLALNIKVGFAF